ncbi:F-box protein: endocytic membrane traffic, recycling ReCYcling 1 [Coemansia sp. RSA 2322]|nr:F-box protein: endocytic membrane traffic, recycling ReCYcling 1 [Coemansia sp. RSA 2322]
MFARGDCAGMQRAARVLEHIRDGRACIDVLAAAHPLVGSAREMPARYARVADAGARVTDSQSLGAFLDALHAVIGEHARVAALALPPPALPASALLGFVRALFAPRGLALRTLQQLYAHLRAVPVVAHVTQAAAVRSAVVAPDAAAKDVLFLETVAGAVAQLLAAARAWAAMRPVAVDAALGRRCVFAAFDDVIADYVQLERRVLGRAYAAALAQWTAATPPPPVGSSRSAPRAASFQQRLHAIEELKQRVLRVAEGAEKRGAAEDVLPHAPLSIDLCVDLLLANRDAVARLAVFAAAPPDMALRRLALDAIEAVFCALLQSVGNHIRPAFTGVVADLKQLEQAAVSSAGPVAADSGPAVYSPQSLQAEKELRERVAAVELRFVEVIHLTDLAVQLLEIYYKKDMGAFIKETDFLNICNQEKRALERAVDDSVAVGMDSVIEIVLRQTRHILDSEQRAADYHPDSGTSLALTPTLACVRAVQFLGESGAALQCMTAHKQMRDVFMGELGVRLFSVLLDNIKRFQITEPGGFQLIADLNLYYDWAATAAVDADTLRFFAALKDLANCFILAPKDLRAFLRDQYSRRTFDGVMRSEEVYDVVACRADYRAIRTQVEGHCDFM